MGEKPRQPEDPSKFEKELQEAIEKIKVQHPPEAEHEKHQKKEIEKHKKLGKNI